MKISKKTKKELLYYMKLTRSIEDRIERKLYRQGKIVGGVYVGRGQEAIGVGSAIHMEEDDIVAPTHRDMGIFLIRGISVRRIIAQYMGRKTGVTKGKDANMHMGDLNHNVIAFVSHLADNVPVAAGCALAFKMRGEKRVALCYNGDGAVSRGDWHEGVNLATVHKLPIVFFINNNAYAYSTPLNLQMAVENVADRAVAYAMPGEIVDGNDVLAVYEASERAIRRARQGEGPSLVEFKTFRMTGHSAHDDAGYVPRELFEEWQKRDPIPKLETFMKKEGEITQEEIDNMQKEIEETIDDAVQWAENSPFPDPEDTLKGVYYEE
ncbi:MAG: thiamine pyrophosphate-dependent dehydrogenase E1 component subunit alpha [Candidatus Latescibacteria bacterium]|nr:thiamine pyrophosphate-dependent dehydrogenase E1 component subunit alpha [Candidatus Latescibacterota bacterium]NIO01030.1 thiamine pyrophosphate-dependent dehydrogenase E1 component subunit alpha [Candidatus Latescibacterota bacterium]NIO27429.1 thiamine pyrophosphate-dependent dehydrogenase E1 component subunit alpha [Candidatus Latescibacterota bacterium]NIO54951.1 thiamine pyrophosphate-dependent dehydrogenase E1 component subunit alpha [Candidatus Latescibacterota bacterium]NIT01040.1 